MIGEEMFGISTLVGLESAQESFAAMARKVSPSVYEALQTCGITIVP